MSINVQKLLDQIETRYNALDSNSTLSEIQRITELHARKDNAILTGAKQYASVGQATSPSGITDSANVGEIYFVADQELDSSGRFFFRSLNGLINMKTATDSAENLSITAAASASGSEASADPAYQGTQYGYSVAGASQDATDRYSFTSDGNSTDIITFTDERQGMTGGQGTTKGYVTGGYYAPTRRNDIYSFPFANADAWTDTTYSSTTSQYRAQKEAVGPPDRSTCYVFGGNAPSGNQNVIEKFGTEGSEANSTDVGDLQAVNSQGAGQSSPTHGYLAGGATPTITNMIQKVAFATDGNSTDVSNLDTTLYLISGTSSTENGYVAGGRSPVIPAGRNLIQKHPFASDANSTDTTADLTASYYNNTGTSSTTHGYTAGGYRGTSPAGNTNAIEKYSFSADENATDVGDLTVGRQWAAGLQN